MKAFDNLKKKYPEWTMYIMRTQNVRHYVATKTINGVFTRLINTDIDELETSIKGKLYDNSRD